MILPMTLMTAMISNTAPLEPGDSTRTLRVDQRARSYILHVPPSYDGRKPVPVVLIFHGGASNARQMISFTGLNEKADEAGFLAVYPNGTGLLERRLTWNAGSCCGYAERNNVDDVTFVRELLDDLAKVARVDSKRVYATGMSNGAIMSYRLASELSDRIAAVAPVSGPMGARTCHPKRPVSVMHFHGTDDQFAPFAGGRGKRSITRTAFLSVDYTIQAWVKANGCPETPHVANEPDKVSDGTTVKRKTYGPGKNNSEVILFEIHGAGHTWPGRVPPLRFLGPATRDISANDLMWAFFEKHPMD